MSFSTYHQTHESNSGHEISKKRRVKEKNSAGNVAERRVSREKKTICTFFILKKKVSMVMVGKTTMRRKKINEQ